MKTIEGVTVSDAQKGYLMKLDGGPDRLAVMGSVTRRLLIDRGLIESFLPDDPPYREGRGGRIRLYRLTEKGHRVVEAMKTEKSGDEALASGPPTC